jgi:GNAT superfamily N-acetyltransferase
VGYRSPEPLEPDHDLDHFSCGEPALDDWLRRHARASHAGGGARVYITTTTEHPRQVVAYYALAAAQVEPPDATPRLAKGQPARRPVPVVLLARLAVDRSHQGRHVGASLLKDAILRVLQAADTIGVRAILVHAKDESARAFYAHYGFEASPTDPLHLILLIKDAKRVITQT